MAYKMKNPEIRLEKALCLNFIFDHHKQIFNKNNFVT